MFQRYLGATQFQSTSARSAFLCFDGELIEEGKILIINSFLLIAAHRSRVKHLFRKKNKRYEQ